ncbi:MAG: 2'-5' RNA ligase family protein [Verrucomicrobia bacterium]|nr:2'-5' RNA ligase family protein [Verrucomicrobiota bacterium]
MPRADEPIAEYVADVSSWKPWQQEYRFGVILVVPPEPLLSRVNALRERYGWSQSGECDAHISLTVPVPRALNRADWRELQAIAAGIEPFEIRYGPLMNYLPHPGVCLAIEPQAALDRLRIVVEGASCFAGATPRRFPFSAHMTIPELISVEQTHEIMAELKTGAPQGTFLCDSLCYLVPDAGFRFVERGRLAMGRA